MEGERADLSNLAIGSTAAAEVIFSVYNPKKDLDNVRELYLGKNQMQEVPTKALNFAYMTVLVYL